MYHQNILKIEKILEHHWTILFSYLIIWNYDCLKVSVPNFLKSLKLFLKFWTFGNWKGRLRLFENLNFWNFESRKLEIWKFKIWKLNIWKFSSKGIPSTPQHSDSHPCTRLKWSRSLSESGPKSGGPKNLYIFIKGGLGDECTRCPSSHNPPAPLEGATRLRGILV